MMLTTLPMMTVISWIKMRGYKTLMMKRASIVLPLNMKLGLKARSVPGLSQYLVNSPPNVHRGLYPS
jgi:hypothetical protein